MGTFGSPLYLLWAKFQCWDCSAKTQTVALAASSVNGHDAELCLLSDVSALPEGLLRYIRMLTPYYQRRFSEMHGERVYTNICPKCNAALADFYLRYSPGCPYSPRSAREARKLTLERIPFEGEFQIEASYGVELGEFIKKHARKVSVVPSTT